MSDPRINISDLESELRQFSPAPTDPHVRAIVQDALNAPIASIPPTYSPADRRLLSAMAMGAAAALVIAACSLDMFESSARPAPQEPTMAAAQQTTQFLAALAAGKDPFRDPRAPQ